MEAFSECKSQPGGSQSGCETDNTSGVTPQHSVYTDLSSEVQSGCETDSNTGVAPQHSVYTDLSSEVQPQSGFETDSNPGVAPQHSVYTDLSSEVQPQSGFETDSNPGVAPQHSVYTDLSSEVQPQSGFETDSNPGVAPQHNVYTDLSPELQSQSGFETDSNPGVAPQHSVYTDLSSEVQSGCETDSNTGVAPQHSVYTDLSSEVQSGCETDSNTGVAPQHSVYTDLSSEVQSGCETDSNPGVAPQHSVYTDLSSEVQSGYETDSNTGVAPQHSVYTDLSSEVQSGCETDSNTGVAPQHSMYTDLSSELQPESGCETDTNPGVAPQHSVYTDLSPELQSQSGSEMQSTSGVTPQHNKDTNTELPAELQPHPDNSVFQWNPSSLSSEAQGADVSDLTMSSDIPEVQTGDLIPLETSQGHTDQIAPPEGTPHASHNQLLAGAQTGGSTGSWCGQTGGSTGFRSVDQAGSVSQPARDLPEPATSSLPAEERLPLDTCEITQDKVSPDRIIPQFKQTPPAISSTSKLITLSDKSSHKSGSKSSGSVSRSSVSSSVGYNIGRSLSQLVRATWSKDTHRAGELSQEDLPRLIRIRHHPRVLRDPATRILVGRGGVSHVSKTPICLVSMHRTSKVVASALAVDADTGDMSVAGPKLVIPVNYPGWFQFVEDGNTKIHALTTIQEVSNLQLKEFVVHSPISAYHHSKQSNDGKRLYAKQRVTAGEVLTTRNVLTEWLSEESIDQSRCLCLRRKKRPDVSYLKCRDTSGRRLLVPLATKGAFSSVGQKGEQKSDASYQLTDIARWIPLPVTLKLVCGRSPDSLETFNGLLRLEQLYFEQSLLGCTAGIRKEYDHQMVEFPTEFDLKFVKCDNWSEVAETDEIHSALLHSEENLNEFVTSIKVERYVDEEGSSLECTDLDLDIMASPTRALPPTPQLPSVAKSKKLKPWTWARNLLSNPRKSSSRKHIDTVSEDSDYEVIPHYLRRVNTEEEDQRCAEICDQIEKANFGCDNVCNSSEKDETATVHTIDTVPLSSPPRQPLMRVRSSPKSESAHDEDGYLLPMEVRDSMKHKTIELPRSPLSGKAMSGDLSTSFRSSALDNCSSTTMTREADLTTGSLNKSTDTLLAPPSSGTVRTYINSVAESEYSSNRFDQDRLDAFLADSLHELHRRQTKELEILESEQKIQKTKHSPEFDNKEDVKTYLEKIFDCDTMSSEDTVLDSQTSSCLRHPPGRSMSFPDNMLPRNSSIRTSRTCHECGYHTLDSGIFLSPRSAVSDPSRPDQDSSIYRSISDCSWVPPESLRQLTVEEVGLSLRYIGMKDHIVTMFCEEQLDGQQLVELNRELLTEGFPELNALDRKKLMDFINGWRPKKWGCIPGD